MKMTNADGLKVLSVVVAGIAATGCSSTQQVSAIDKISKEELAIERMMAMNSYKKPGISYLPSSMGIEVSLLNPVSKEMRSKKLNMRLPSKAKMRDLIQFLSEADIIVGVGSSISSDDEKKDEEGSSNSFLDDEVTVARFNGTLGQLIDTLRVSNGLFFEEHDGILTARDRTTMTVSIPQDAEAVSVLTNDLTGLGASAISVSTYAGVMTFDVNAHAYNRVSRYLKRLKQNMAMVDLEVSVITISKTDAAKAGLDLRTIKAVKGYDLTAPGMVNSDVIKDLSMIMDAGSLSTLVMGSDWAVQGLVNFLDEVTEVKTTQNLSLKTLAGRKVTVVSGREVPYVSGVEVSTTDAGTATGITTDVTISGLNMDITPRYDGEGGLVSLDLNMVLSNVVSLVELSAGTQIGTITQPQTEQQTFNDMAILRAGEIAMIGGITLKNTENQSLSAVPFQDQKVHNQDALNESAMYILIRPTVTVFTKARPKLEGLNVDANDFNYAPDKHIKKAVQAEIQHEVEKLKMAQENALINSELERNREELAQLKKQIALELRKTEVRKSFQRKIMAAAPVKAIESAPGVTELPSQAAAFESPAALIKSEALSTTAQNQSPQVTKSTLELLAMENDAVLESTVSENKSLASDKAEKGAFSRLIDWFKAESVKPYSQRHIVKEQNDWNYQAGIAENEGAAKSSFSNIRFRTAEEIAADNRADFLYNKGIE